MWNATCVRQGAWTANHEAKILDNWPCRVRSNTGDNFVFAQGEVLSPSGIEDANNKQATVDKLLWNSDLSCLGTNNLWPRTEE